jgi:pentatricopeptide repeat protein
MPMNRDKILSSTLADIYLQQGHVEKAVEIYGKLSRREPENDFYKKRLASIKKELKAKSSLPAFKRILNKKIW